MKDASADQIIEWLEEEGLGWAFEHTGHLIEARIWKWPHLVARYKPTKVEPLADMLRGAIDKIPHNARPQRFT